MTSAAFAERLPTFCEIHDEAKVEEAAISYHTLISESKFQEAEQVWKAFARTLAKEFHKGRKFKFTAECPLFYSFGDFFHAPIGYFRKYPEIYNTQAEFVNRGVIAGTDANGDFINSQGQVIGARYILSTSVGNRKSQTSAATMNQIKAIGVGLAYPFEAIAIVQSPHSYNSTINYMSWDSGGILLELQILSIKKLTDTNAISE